jgi:hypothetical protein
MTVVGGQNDTKGDQELKMSEIRILSEDDFDAFARITVNAYPGMVPVSEEKVKELLSNLTFEKLFHDIDEYKVVFVQ